MKSVPILLLSVTALPALAEVPLSAEAFEAEVTGKTYLYFENGEIYGAERYLPGRRVEWSYLDMQCSEGVWYPVGDQICFEYEELPSPQCWVFTLDGDTLTARFTSNAEDRATYLASPSPEPLQCLGPEVGV